MDNITKSIEKLGNTKRELFQNALKYFNIPEEEKEDRVSIYYTTNSIEQVFIDHQLVLTFSPLRIDLDGKVKMDYQEHYIVKGA